LYNHFGNIKIEGATEEFKNQYRGSFPRPDLYMQVKKGPKKSDATVPLSAG